MEKITYWIMLVVMSVASTIVTMLFQGSKHKKEIESLERLYQDKMKFLDTHVEIMSIALSILEQRMKALEHPIVMDLLMQKAVELHNQGKMDNESTNNKVS